jgi:hypothetical protein
MTGSENCRLGDSYREQARKVIVHSNRSVKKIVLDERKKRSRGELLTPWSESFAEDVSRKDYPEAPPSPPPLKFNR